MDTSVSVVIPAHDEARAIAEVIGDLRREPLDLAEIIVVDDGSTDDTAARAGAAGAVVIRHNSCRGYGAALKTGILAAKGAFVATLDGDGQHRPADVALLLQRARDHDLVSGHRVRWFHSPAWRLPGKWLLRRMSGFLVRRNIPDLNCGLRVYRRDAIVRALPLCPNGYSFSSTSLMLFLHQNFRVVFVPIEVRPAVGRGHVTVLTGFEVLVLLLRLTTLLDPLRVFLPASVAFGLAGVLWGLPYAVAGRGVSVGALLLVITGVLLFMVGLVSDQIAQLRKEWLDR